MYEPAQDPTSQQGFNRYAYCFYNPLKYVDPTGERASGPDFRMMAAMIERMIREQCYNKWRDFLMGMGCISMIDINGSWGEFNWCKGGSGSGNSGGGSSIAPKNENGEMIADTSGPMVGDDYKKKCAELGITPGKPIPEDKRNDEFLRLFQQAFFPDAPMDWVRKFTCENVPANKMETMEYVNALGMNSYSSFCGDMNTFVDVYFNSDLCFASTEDLYVGMAHELLHVSQYEAMYCDFPEYTFADCFDASISLIRGAMETQACNFEKYLNGAVINHNIFLKGTLLKTFDYINFKWIQYLP